MKDLRKIKLDITDDIGVVTIDSPPQNFLYSPEFIKKEDLKSFVDNNNLKGIILKGEGRHFSAGADLNNLFKLAQKEENLFREIQNGKELLNYIEKLDIPVLSAIRGVCFGGGLEIALASHIKVCSNKSLFSFPEINHNLMPGLDGIRRIHRNIKKGKAIEAVLSGDIIDAETAIEIGIIDYIKPQNEVYDFSINMMRKMTSERPLDVIKSVMKSINNINREGKDTFEDETKMFCKLAVKEAKRRSNPINIQ